MDYLQIRLEDKADSLLDASSSTHVFQWIENLAEREFHKEHDWIQGQDPVILLCRDKVMEHIKSAHPSGSVISIIRVVKR